MRLSAGCRLILTRCSRPSSWGSCSSYRHRTLKEQAGAGVIPHHRFGKHYRFSRDDVREILRRTQHEAPVRRTRPRLVA